MIGALGQLKATGRKVRARSAEHRESWRYHKRDVAYHDVTYHKRARLRGRGGAYGAPRTEPLCDRDASRARRAPAQKCTIMGIWQQGIVLKRRSSSQKSLCPVVLHPVSVRRFPSFRTQPLENLSRYQWKQRFLSNPAPGENLLSGNLVMETTGCTNTTTATTTNNNINNSHTISILIILAIIIIIIITIPLVY